MTASTNRAQTCACHGWLECPVIDRIISLPGGERVRVIEDQMADQPAKRADGKIYGLRFRVLRVVPA